MGFQHVLSVLVLAAVGATGGEPPPTPPVTDVAVLERRIAELEQQVATLQRELQGVRKDLQALVRPAAALTPAEAVQAFQRDPKKVLTVEFGIESTGWPDAPTRSGEDQMPPILADWDGRLPNGGKFTLFLTPKAIQGLKDVGVELGPSPPAGLMDVQRIAFLCKHLKGKGVRVTGLVQPSRPGARYTDYYLIVDDPANFRINK
jgi:hypothetical protein